mmetsp:Transcript_53453/g.78244  ORF Transcript_53453/g.78244 Transcript_53453/m.78244 type:complete len:580 (+) Transcript_53453:69-1808(+)
MVHQHASVRPSIPSAHNSVLTLVLLALATQPTAAFIAPTPLCTPSSARIATSSARIIAGRHVSIHAAASAARGVARLRVATCMSASSVKDGEKNKGGKVEQMMQEVDEDDKKIPLPSPIKINGATPPKDWLDPKAAKELLDSRGTLPVQFQDISKAAFYIRGSVRKTACEPSPGLSELTGATIFVKEEYKQFTGSFKERGARNALMQLEEAQKSKGVIAASAGNHALALSYHGGLLNISVTVVMPTNAPLVKVNKCRKLGANVVLHGAHIGEAKDHALSSEQYEGLQYINGYDDPAIIAGAGTCGLEIVEQVPDLDVVVIPVGGAGLIAGMALAIKTLRPNCMIIGVEPEYCASYTRALAAGKPVAVTVMPTLGDGLAVPCVGPHSFEVARKYVDKVVTVSEKYLALAVLRCLEHEKAVVEGGGAAGLAALLPGGPLDIPELKGKRIAIPLCGGNIDITMLGRVIERGLAADRRLIRFAATVTDRPGGLAALVTIISKEGASVMDIAHERAWLHTSVDQVINKVIVEVTGAEHEQRLKKALEDAGYPLQWDLGSEYSDTQTGPDWRPMTHGYSTTTLKR